MTGPARQTSRFRIGLLAGAALYASASVFAGPAHALSELQPAPTAEDLKKPAKPGDAGGVDGGDDDGGGAQPAPPAGGQPKPPAGGGDDGDDGGGGAQPAPPAGGQPKPPAGGVDGGDDGGGGAQPAPPAGGQPKPPAGGGDDGDDGGGGAQPAPPAGEQPKPPAGGGEDGGEDEGGGAQPTPPATPPPASGDEAGDPARPPTDDGGPIPEILYDLTALPQPVMRMRELIVEACKTGDPEKLRPLIGTGESRTRLTLDEAEDDPVEILKQSSGDGEGQEILAILLEVLEAGYVHLDAGKDTELYVWPYFFAVPLEKLSTPQRVELFKLITAGDYEDMKGYGAYIFYRVGITPDGKWDFFLAGD